MGVVEKIVRDWKSAWKVRANRKTVVILAKPTVEILSPQSVQTFKQTHNTAVHVKPPAKVVKLAKKVSAQMPPAHQHNSNVPAYVLIQQQTSTIVELAGLPAPQVKHVTTEAAHASKERTSAMGNASTSKQTEIIAVAAETPAS